ncbi:MAG: hypothetical protein ACI856_000325, partial [Kiritimatiellia bacterium]
PVVAADVQTLFNGTDLDGWMGKADFWRVEKGAIVGQTTAEKPTSGNTFLVWTGGDVDDFDFVCMTRFKGNNSGVQYRSKVVDEKNVVVAGYQADLHPAAEYFGMLYGEKMPGRGIIAKRGQKVVIDAGGKTSVVGSVGNTDALVDWEWNELRIVAVGNRLIHQINGVTTVDITDDHPGALSKGVIALQLHAGPAMTVVFKDLKLTALKGEAAQAVLKSVTDEATATK